MIELFTSAPERYDGFSTTTVEVVGRDCTNGNPVRLVKVEERDYQWQTARYSSGLYRYTGTNRPLEMYVRFGDWELNPPESELLKALWESVVKATDAVRERGK